MIGDIFQGFYIVYIIIWQFLGWKNFTPSKLGETWLQKMQNGKYFLGEKHGKLAHWAKIFPLNYSCAPHINGNGLMMTISIWWVYFKILGVIPLNYSIFLGPKIPHTWECQRPYHKLQVFFKVFFNISRNIRGLYLHLHPNSHITTNRTIHHHVSRSAYH